MVKDIAIGTRGLMFDYRVGQFGHGVANGSPPLPLFFSELCCPGPKQRKWPRHSLHAVAPYRKYDEDLI